MISLISLGEIDERLAVADGLLVCWFVGLLHEKSYSELDAM
jgi:hypothetical protein